MNYRIFILFFFCFTVSASDNKNEIPAEYFGVWDANLKSCEVRFSDLRITIGKDTIEYIESTGQVVKLEVADGNKIEIELAMTGEGEEWVRRISFNLLENETKLVETLSGIPPVNRFRCDKSKMPNKN